MRVLCVFDPQRGRCIVWLLVSCVVVGVCHAWPALLLLLQPTQ